MGHPRLVEPARRKPRPPARSSDAPGRGRCKSRAGMVGIRRRARQPGNPRRPARSNRIKPMFLRLFLICAVAILAARANQTGPSEFYIVSVSISDNGGLFYLRILSVKQEGPDSIVRYIRIGPRSVPCPLKTLQAVETRVPNTTPAQLVETNNPCALKPGSLKFAIKKYARRTSVL